MQIWVLSPAPTEKTGVYTNQQRHKPNNKNKQTRNTHNQTMWQRPLPAATREGHPVVFFANAPSVVNKTQATTEISHLSKHFSLCSKPSPSPHPTKHASLFLAQWRVHCPNCGWASRTHEVNRGLRKMPHTARTPSMLLSCSANGLPIGQANTDARTMPHHRHHPHPH